MQTEVKYTHKQAYHATIKLSNILTNYGLAPTTREEVQEKLVIKVDTHDQQLQYEPMIIPLTTFGTNALIQVAPLEVIMAMKIYTIGQRRRAKGRDYFDLKFLMDKGIHPNHEILDQLL
ncbi:MAG: nucleotidyl transferase AbiEii/AbiGii toxin family protein [Candidatus Peribacteria bacterium]|nr:MAG: nucleotidyl transferase AbiEii/AbiGii toxin family protein [Candidatus Peribacteria bacterium]